MASRRRDSSAKTDEKTLRAEAQAAIMVTPAVTVVDIANGSSESLWVWELED